MPKPEVLILFRTSAEADRCMFGFPKDEPKLLTLDSRECDGRADEEVLETMPVGRW